MADHNEIVTQGFSKYIGSVMQGGSAELYFAIGTGSASWDGGNVPVPASTIDSLVDEVYKVAVPTTDIVYVDPSTREESAEPTTMVKVTAEIPSSAYSGYVREYGLLYGISDPQVDQGTPIVYGNHIRMRIPAGSTYTKTMYIGT